VRGGRRGYWALAVVFAIACALASVQASTPRFFQAATEADFLRGELENLSVDASGQLVLGPASDLVYETSAPFLWSILAAPDGTLFVGTGNEGKVFRIDTQGRGSLYFDSPELEVHAIAPAPDGGLYVATSPDGKIYRVDRAGTATTFFDPDDKYIWSLAVDARGNVYAGTGEKGVVYRISPNGTGAPFYRAAATHATSLAINTAGDLLVATGSPGRILKVDSEGKGFLLLDSPFQEIRALRFDDRGVLYAAGQSGRPSAGGAPAAIERPTPEPGRALVPTVSVEVTSVSVADASSSPAGPGRDDRGGGAATGGVYRINPDGIWDQIWESRADAPYDLAFDQDGTLVIGTGNKGKVYRLQGDPARATLVARASAQQVTSLYRDARGRLHYATANPGKIFRLASERAARGTYESEPHDAQMVATWGSLSWRGRTTGGGRIELFTRTGNTPTPDDTWSEWSSAYSSAEGSPISSPKARYLQWRAVLSGRGDGPALSSVTAAYLQRNLRPQVRAITVHPPGIVFQKAFSGGEPELAGFSDLTTPDRKLAVAAALPTGAGSPALGRRAYQKGLQTLVWTADDENGDELAYDVLYRREGEAAWKTLRQALSETVLVWDTATVPNGTYVVKIVASDGPSNPGGDELAGELESVSLEIDNTPPVVTIDGVRSDRGQTIVSFGVKDDHSPIERMEISEDGQRWRVVSPVDGIADSREERFRITLEGALPARGLTLRAIDALNNVATAHVDGPQ
jgi:sugar lactone lactonase YvrE